MRSALLSMPNAVTFGEDSPVAWHYGDPLREQRHLATTGAVVDRSDRDVVTVSGPDRLGWLHDITSQHLSALAPGIGTELLVLSPNGHIEIHAMVQAGADTVWLDTEPGQGAALVDYLTKMRFFAQVDITDVTADWAVLTFTGPDELAEPDVLPVPNAQFSAGSLPARPSSQYSGADRPDGGFVRRTDALGVITVDRLVPRDTVGEVVASSGLPVAGAWAYETLRIEALRPRVGVDTDHKTIPHELPELFRRAVHLEKGCYRGQETVARVHNLGKPPRRLVMLHLDGTDEQPPVTDTPVLLGDRTVGRVGTAGRHHENGMVALALLRRNVADNPQSRLTVAGSAAAVA